MNFSLPSLLTGLVVLALSHAPAARAADIFVNNVAGNDNWSGLTKNPVDQSGPVRTIARAVALAGPGDTIHLEPFDIPYAEEVLFRNKSGEPGRPITVDGHGATIDGSEACPVEGWKRAGDHLWLLANTSSRNALIVNDRLILERKLGAELQPGEFCFENTQFEADVLFFRPPENRKVKECTVEVIGADGRSVILDSQKWKGGPVFRFSLTRSGRPVRVMLDGAEAPFLQAKDRLKPGEWCMEGNDLYLYPPDGKNPSDLAIRTVVRGTGVSLSGNSSHITIQNLNVRFVWNDAYNIHGKVVQATFVNCNARDCFDEGFSAHDSSETVLDGAIFERCDNGVFNVNEGGWSVTRNLVVRDCRDYGFGVAVTDSRARHWLQNAMLENNPIPLFGRHLDAENIQISNSSSARIVLAGPLSVAQATVSSDATTIEILPGTGPLRFAKSVFVSVKNQEIVFKKPTALMLDSVLWSPQTTAVTRLDSPSLPLLDWLEKLGEDSINSGALAEGTKSPEHMGFRPFDK